MNVRLVTAAPEMFAALKGIQHIAYDIIHDLCAVVQECGKLDKKEVARWQAVLDAIAKAEGRS